MKYSIGQSDLRNADFAQLVKALRKARGLTQEQLARELQVTFSTVNGWENRKHQPIRALASRLLEMAASEAIHIREQEEPYALGTTGTGKKNRSITKGRKWQK